MMVEAARAALLEFEQSGSDKQLKEMHFVIHGNYEDYEKEEFIERARKMVRADDRGKAGLKALEASGYAYTRPDQLVPGELDWLMQQLDMAKKESKQ